MENVLKLSFLNPFQYKTMRLGRSSTNLLVLWIILHATRAQNVDTGTDHSPQVQIHMKVRTPIDVNSHLREMSKTNAAHRIPG